MLRLVLVSVALHASTAQDCRPADAVVITAHGRSGSTLVERAFDLNPHAISYFEPLRPWI